MNRREIYQVSHGYIDELLRAKGCARGSIRPKPGPRYERTRPNELWHIDIKGPFFINLAGKGYIKTWLVGIVDDHSRFVIGLRILPGAKAAPILTWLEECFELCGQPIQLMSDNGQPFVVWMPGVLTLFGKRLRELHIEHLRTQISSPWTNGKIEAFWAVLQQEVLDRQRFAGFSDAETAMAGFAHYYNYHRLSGRWSVQFKAAQSGGVMQTAQNRPRCDRPVKTALRWRSLITIRWSRHSTRIGLDGVFRDRAICRCLKRHLARRIFKLLRLGG